MASSLIVDKKSFWENGFCKVPGLLDGERLHYFRELIARTDNGSSFDTIKKNTYNVGIDEAPLLALLNSSSFSDLIAAVGYGDSVFTDGIVFETDHDLPGFDWHLDVTSFKYIQPNDRAFSIWIALDPIDPAGQDGGMTLLSTSSFSGCEFFKLQSRVTKALHEKRYKIPSIYKTLLGPLYRSDKEKQFKKMFPSIEKRFPHLFSDSLYISGFSKKLFDLEGVSFSLEPGDAVIFDKNVFHRSNPLGIGPMKSRRAFVMRFIEANSTFNEINAAKAGGDDTVLVRRMTVGDGMPFDLRSQTVIKSKAL